MVMELYIKDGPRPVEVPQDSSSLLHRNTTEEERSARLWLVTVSLEIRGPVSWWKQARHYFSEILWLRARPGEDESERQLLQDDFEQPVPEAVLEHLNGLVRAGARPMFQSSMPDSFVRRGVVHTNLAVLRDIIEQRGHYNEGHWWAFCRNLREHDSLNVHFPQSEKTAQ